MAQCPNEDGSSERQTEFDAPFDLCINSEKTYSAEMKTSFGDLTIHLDTIGAPFTANNFICLARYHYYDGLTFHRVIQDFVIQGGCSKGDGTGGPGYRFADELPKPGTYELGSLVMANAGPDTNGSQFFVISGQNGVALPPQYAMFGKVVAGMEVVEKIQSVATGAQDKPNEDVVIESVTILEK